MPLPPKPYTTEDEIKFIRRLAGQGKWEALKGYRMSLPYRVYTDQTGLMEVDKVEVKMELDTLLGPETMEEKQEHLARRISRMADAWDRTGAIQYMAQRAQGGLAK